jgi:ribonuclease P protein component
MSDEAHLSAKQPGSCPSARVPFTDGDTGRTRRDPRASIARAQDAVGLKSVDLATITKRRDFLAANNGRRAPMPGFVLIVRDRADGDLTKRIGITVTKKIGGAVARNRLKRRFRALARDVLTTGGLPGSDHILIGRPDGLTRDFITLRRDLVRALEKVAR